jgi:hypothetical protein
MFVKDKTILAMLCFVSIVVLMSLAAASRAAQINQRYCVNCKHYIPNPFIADKSRGKCRLFEIIEPKRESYVVDPGDDEEEPFIPEPYAERFFLRFMYCDIVRRSDSLCGPGGKYYCAAAEWMEKIQILRR